MKEVGIEFDIVVFINLFSGYVYVGKMVDVYDFMKDMRRRGFESNANCYTVLI